MTVQKQETIEYTGIDNGWKYERQLLIIIINIDLDCPFNITWRDDFCLARHGSTIDFHLLWHTVELAMSTHLCLL